MEALFQSWDLDSSGAISLVELRSILKRGMTKATAYLQQVALDAEKDNEAQSRVGSRDWRAKSRDP